MSEDRTTAYNRLLEARVAAKAVGDEALYESLTAESDALEPLDAPFDEPYTAEKRRLLEVGGSVVADCVCALCDRSVATVRRIEGRHVLSTKRYLPEVEHLIQHERRSGVHQDAPTSEASVILEVPLEQRDGPVRDLVMVCKKGHRLSVDEAAVLQAAKRYKPRQKVPRVALAVTP